jgi:regulator of sirC expression with transglutaminase-like and TPR domain
VDTRYSLHPNSSRIKELGNEAIRWIDEITGGAAGPREQYLQPATHRQWIARMLANLQNLFTRQSRTA